MITQAELKKIAQKETLTAMAKRFDLPLAEAKRYLKNAIKNEPNGDIAQHYNKLVDDSLEVLGQYL